MFLSAVLICPEKKPESKLQPKIADFKMIKMEQQSYYDDNVEEKPRGGFHDNMDAAKAAGSGYHEQMEGKPTPRHITSWRIK